jgi:hypothetical protein
MGVSCPSATACVAVGGFGTGNAALAEHWDGASWTARAITKPDRAVLPTLEAVSCTVSSECTAVGFNYASGGDTNGLIERFS